MELTKDKKLTKEEYAELQLASHWTLKFKDSMIAKSPYTKRWADYWDAWRGEYFKNTSLPEYKSNLVSNYIFSIIETIRPIMFDNDPKYQAIPRQPEGLAFSNDWQEALSYEWDREQMMVKFIREAITTLVVGTSVIFLPWDKDKKNVCPVFINPDNIFPDPLATTVEDAGYIMYARYFHEELLRQKFPGKAKRLTGSRINYSELVQGNDKNVNQMRQILVVEAWVRDYETLELNADNTYRPKYPNGRVITFCPDLGIVLADKPNPYNDGSFPFRLIKDYDVPNKFWGEGEVAQLLSPQRYMNELTNAIIDNAKTTANAPWIVDKNSGIGEGKITSRPGLVIRKNPGSEVRREMGANMPNFVPDTVAMLKSDMEQVSGIFDSIKGNSETGVYTAQGVLALQEAGQARIRLKVKLLENALSEIAKLWVSRIRQFWKDDRFIAVTHQDGSYDVKKFNSEAFKYDYDVKITAGSTMPVNRGAMLDLMIRLAQTPMPDGQNLVDREAVVAYLPEEAKSSILRRMNNTNTQLQQQVEQITQAMQQNDQKDEQNMQVLEQVTGALEQLKKEILQLEQKHATLEKDKAEQDKINKIQNDSYNQGYGDAQKESQESPGQSAQESLMGENPLDKAEGVPNPDENGDGIPDDVVNGLSELSDEELQRLIEKHPELAQLLNAEQPGQGTPQGGF
jgi:hypothetical protein